MHLNVVATLRCNLRCAHCIYGCPLPGDLDPGSYARTLDALVPRGLGSLTFTGGEPCMHPEFDALADEAGRRDLRFGVVSNGWSLEAYDGAVARHRDLFTGFHLSLDGLEPTHDGIRGPGSFARVAAALERCRTRGVPARVNFVVSDQNQGELDAVVAWAAASGAGGVKLAGLISVPRAPGLSLSPQVRLAAARRAGELAGAHAIPVEVAASLLTPATVEFCPVLTSSTFTLNERGEITWCCDVPGSASALGRCERSADQVLARRKRTKDEMVLDRILKLREGGLALEDRSCAYCHAFFGVGAPRGR
jgi:molybdenum cofactor biosynthesis enzyme MoaA